VTGLCVAAVDTAGAGQDVPQARVCDGSRRQDWERTDDGRFRNRATGDCLKADDRPATQGSGALVSLEPCRSGPLWQWSFGF
jgi:hypothetical protein